MSNNIKEVNSTDYKTTVFNPYESLEQLIESIVDFRKEHEDAYRTELITLTKDLNPVETLTQSLDIAPNQVFLNTYVLRKDDRYHWLNCNIDLINFKTLDELTKELSSKFDKDYEVAKDKERVKEEKTEEDYKYELVIENPYKTLDELIEDVAKSTKEPYDILVILGLCKYINSEENLIVALELIKDKYYINTYIYYNEEYTLWIEFPLELSDFKDLDELLEEIKYHFEYNYAVALHERSLYGDDDEEVAD